MQRFRIILTVHFSMWSRYSGGGQRSTHNLALALCEMGHEVHVINTKAAAEKVEVPHDLPYRQYFATYPGIKDSRKAFFRNSAVKSIKDTADKILSKASSMPNILHCNGEEGALLHELQHKYTVKIVSTVRYSHYPTPMKEKKRSIPAQLLLKLKHSKYLLQEKTATHADMVCPPSEWAAREVIAAFHLDATKVEAVPNGVPKEFLEYQRNPSAIVKGDLLFFGRLSHDKGVDVLIRAYANIRASIARKLHIVGKGPMEEGLRKLVNELALKDEVLFHGWENHHQIGKRLEQTCMCILPSLDENYSLALLGSLCTGTATISTAVGGSPEIIHQGRTGLLVAPSNMEELEHAILRLHTDHTLNERLGKNGMQFVREQRTWQDSAQHFCRIYEGLYSLGESAVELTD